MLDLFINDKMSYSTDVQYLDYSNQEFTPWSLNTTQETLAGAIKVGISFRDDPVLKNLNVDKYYRVQFYQFQMTEGGLFEA